MNWKPYWGINNDSYILHYHWLKPDMSLDDTDLKEKINNIGERIIDLESTRYYFEFWKNFENGFVGDAGILCIFRLQLAVELHFSHDCVPFFGVPGAQKCVRILQNNEQVFGELLHFVRPVRLAQVFPNERLQLMHNVHYFACVDDPFFHQIDNEQAHGAPLVVRLIHFTKPGVILL